MKERAGESEKGEGEGRESGGGREQSEFEYYTERELERLSGY